MALLRAAANNNRREEMTARQRAARQHFSRDLQRARAFRDSEPRDYYCHQLMKIYAGLLTTADWRELHSLITNPAYRQELERIEPTLQSAAAEEPRREVRPAA